MYLNDSMCLPCLWLSDLFWSESFLVVPQRFICWPGVSSGNSSRCDCFRLRRSGVSDALQLDVLQRQRLSSSEAHVDVVEWRVSSAGAVSPRYDLALNRWNAPPSVSLPLSTRAASPPPSPPPLPPPPPPPLALLWAPLSSGSVCSPLL